jgi:hypothetical protein
MEIFVFLTMGGERDAMIVKALDAEDAGFCRSLATFDAGKAECFLARDREKLLAVVEASFGTFGPFNRIVRGYFAEKLSSDRSHGSPHGSSHSTARLGHLVSDRSIDSPHGAGHGSSNSTARRLINVETSLPQPAMVLGCRMSDQL